MSLNYKNVNTGTGLTLELALAALLLFWLAVAAVGQTNSVALNEQTTAEVQKPEVKAVLQPVLTGYKEVKIGMHADEVKEKLGKPKMEDKEGFFYVFSDEEQAQINFDADKKVRVISITFVDEEGTAPKYVDVFGKDITVVTKDDGSIYNLVRYPESGYWVAYYRAVGDNPTVTVTMQRMWNAK